MNGSELDLTQPVNDQVGSAFWPTAVDTAHVRIDFDATIAKGTGADGLTAAFIDPIRGGVPTSIGNGGGGLGFATLPGVGVALDTYPSATNASSNSAGIVQGPGPTNDALQWLAIATSIPDLRAKPHHVTVVADQGTVTVSIDGAQVLSKQIWLPARALVGFTAANGGLNDLHAVSNAAVSIG
jgi:hypothetical protein